MSADVRGWATIKKARTTRAVNAKEYCRPEETRKNVARARVVRNWTKNFAPIYLPRKSIRATDAKEVRVRDPAEKNVLLPESSVVGTANYLQRTQILITDFACTLRSFVCHLPSSNTAHKSFQERLLRRFAIMNPTASQNPFPPFGDCFVRTTKSSKL